MLEVIAVVGIVIGRVLTAWADFDLVLIFEAR